MNDHKMPESFDDVLYAFATEAVHDPTQLAEWVRRYPQYSRDLTDFALHHSIMEHGPNAEPDPAADEALVVRAMEVVEAVLAGRAAAKPAHATAPFTDLLGEAKARGLSARGLARALRVPPTMVARLHRRLIRYGSIPRQVVADLAHALEREADAVAAYLMQPPTFAGGVSYKSEGVPVLGEPDDFYPVLLADPNLAEDDREHWTARRAADTEQ